MFLDKKINIQFFVASAMSEDIFVVSKYDYTANEPQELSFKKNERFKLLDDSKNWWKVCFFFHPSLLLCAPHFEDESSLFFDCLLSKVFERQF